MGYETYQKILSEAVHELKNDEFADLYAEEIKGKGRSAVKDLWMNVRWKVIWSCYYRRIM
ncbi:hypothetical protein BFINE_44260 [Bacteroides finegoldii DSM 17565]|nr:hypothetical protein BFINE_44260 [Bacteroides finegoldii DSM 17565]